MAELENKVVIITGASSGIGYACAEEFAKTKCRLVLAARNATNLSNAVAELSKKYNCEIVEVAADVSNEHDCKKIISEALAHFGTIDVLIANAGVSMRAVFNDTDLSVIKQLMDINFWGTVYCTKFALPEILKNHGSIVGVSSIAGYVGLPGRTGYSASKFAMQGFLGALRSENQKNNLHVMICCPGYTQSNIRVTALNKEGKPQGDTPLNESHLMTSEEVAIQIVRGIKTRRRTLVLTAQGKLSVWLSKFFPTLLDKLAFKKISKEADSPF